MSKSESGSAAVSPGSGTGGPAGQDVPSTMRAVRLHSAGDPATLALEEVAVPRPAEGEALVRVHAAAITRDELEWPADRLPAIPSYELSGVVVGAAPGTEDVAPGDEVYALTPFDRDGVAAEYAAVPAHVLARKPASLAHVESAAIPLAALSAWQGLFEHGGLERGQRVLVHGAAGGVGHLATQLARAGGAYVVGTASRAGVDLAKSSGAHEVLDPASDFDDIDPFDLVFDTAGGARLASSPTLLRRGGRLVSVAEEPPEVPSDAGITTTYFVVEPSRGQLSELARLVDDGKLRAAIDAVFTLADARQAFERSMTSGKRGKVVLRIVDE